MAQQADNAAFPEALVDPVPASAPAGRNPSRVRTIAINALRFVSVLVGAGLLLRAGASEHAVSAVDEPRPQPEKPAQSRLVVPQPAFGQTARADGERTKALTAAPITAVTPVAATATAGTALSSARPRKSAAHAGMAKSLTSSAQLLPVVEVSRPAAAKPTVAEPTVAEVVPVAVAPAKRTAVSRRAPLIRDRAAATASLADNTPSILSPSRPLPAAGLLAPVRVVSSAGTDATRSPVLRSAPVPAPAPALAAVRPAPSAPAAAAPVQISLAPPVMRPGPRTTTRTSDIRDVMRRPASAWDYAEGLTPELAGRSAAIPPQTSAQPVVAAQPAPAQLAAARPSVLMRAAPPVAAQAPAGARAIAARPVAKPVAAESRAAPPPAPGRPLALLDLPPSRKLSAALGAGRESAAAITAEASPPVRASALGRARLAPSARRGVRRGSGNANAVQSGQSLAPAGEADAAQVGPASGSQVSSAGNTGSGSPTQLADAAAPARRGLSLRERIPHPAF
ncbi:MAG: hypothetical protein WCL10_12535 [Novosphingobium sp.]|uniref:hypothetical protein n=1 Tax=Novosphingobium sp. TaxID=1874826 RepID=UPI00301A8E92